VVQGVHQRAIVLVQPREDTVSNIEKRGQNQETERGRIACSVNEACAMSGIGRTKLYELIDEKKIQTRQIGRRRLVIIESIRALFQ
jgi:excisionase family DNA binding protein